MSRFRGVLIFVALCSPQIATVAQGPIIVDPRPKQQTVRPMNLLNVGAIAPDWQLSDADGLAHSLSAYRGKVVVLDFWATWCVPCRAVMPRMQKLHQKFEAKGVVVLGVNSWESNDAVALMKEKRYNYELLLNGERIATEYKVVTLPVVYVIGTDGRIIYCHEGPDHENLSSLIEKYLKANGTPKV